MVGYNRRFSPMARTLKQFLAGIHEPLVMHYRVNAGYIPADHWVHDPEQGGGRIIGEVCHFVDFVTFLAGSLPKQVNARTILNEGRYRNDNLTATIEFTNGSIGTITYVANGDRSFPKERIEVFGGGTAVVLDNFRILEMLRSGKRQVMRSRFRQDKGHLGEWMSIVKAINCNDSIPITFEEIVSTALTCFRFIHSLHNSSPVEVSNP
jgi:predicted dehydrogenase